jgi:FixJ family two-component response regulator
MKLYVVDDDSGMRRLLHARLKGHGITAWPFARAHDFLEQLDDLGAAPIIVDLRMPEMGGLELLAALAARDVQWPVIVITACADMEMAVEAMKLGAIEVLEKPIRPEPLNAALVRAFDLLATRARKTRGRQAARAQLALLTARERAVVKALIAGQTNKDIAERMTISPRTVEGHRAHALHKLKVRSVAEIVYVAVDGGLDLRAPSAEWPG